MQGSSAPPCVVGVGIDYCGIAGRYGTQGTFLASNTPGSRAGSYIWTDSSGHLWLFGGEGYDSNFNLGYLNDLWEFDPALNEWTWRGGASTFPAKTSAGDICDIRQNPNPCDIQGTYGAKGVAAPQNTPGSHAYGESWTDRDGNFWMMGGYGLDTNGHYGELNDLWEYRPSTELWTWVAGTDLVDQSGVYGTLGTPAAANSPGARNDGFTWIDANGSLWLYGGGGDCDDDLWQFDVASEEWTWQGGGSSSTGGKSPACDQPAVYGTKGVPAAANSPGRRRQGSSWVDSNGHFWLFGGESDNDPENDVWEFDLSTKEWTWWNGSTNGSVAGSSGTEGQPSPANSPASRDNQVSWIDANGNFWFFGGDVRFDDSCGCTYNDLWEYTPATHEWAWMGGSILSGDSGTPMKVPGQYGTLGLPAPANIPGSRDSGMSWTDSSGNLWLFGGEGYDSTDRLVWLNDLWRYQLSSTIPAQSIPTVAVTLSAGPITVDQTVDVSATVTGATSTPTGTARLTGAGYTSSTTKLNAGTANWTIPAGALGQGQDTLYVDYIPDSGSAAAYFGAYGTAPITVTPPPGFTMAPVNVSFAAGATTGNTATVTVTPVGGFTGSVSLSAKITAEPTDASQPPTFSFGSTSPVNITGSSAGTATMTITTVATQTTTCPALQIANSKGHPEANRLALCGVLLLLGLGRWRRVRTGFWIVILAFTALAASSCGGGGGGGTSCTPQTTPGTTPGVYDIQVTGASGSLSATMTVTLKLN